jgi:hypothetical protein
MSATPKLIVKSHVARDLLQSAGLFKTDKLVVWEYVSNGLQYIGAGTNPVVKVSLDSRKKRISIQDNGRGMDWSGLQNYFVMHGENLDRKEGRPGRGLFGTGKSAAFGIAEVLRITTVRNSKRSQVELKRSSIEAITSGNEIPVEIRESETPVSTPSGTLIEIEGVHLRSLDQAGIIHYIERHLARWPKNATVFVNNHECEFNEPPVASEHRFTPEGVALEILGDVELMIKVSKSFLDDELRGVSVFSNGNWHETTLGGSEGREMSQYIFGEIDVPGLDDDKSPVAPFNVSRSMQLNPENDLVRAIHAFVGSKVEEVRRSLVEADKKRKAEEDTKKLTEQASEIARVINEDFEAFRQRVAKIRAKTRGGPNMSQDDQGGDKLGDDLIFGSDVPAIETSPRGSPGRNGPPNEIEVLPTPEIPPFNPSVEPAENAEPKGQTASGTNTRRRPSGGFCVEFKEMGEGFDRALYVEVEQAIHINLEHPQIAAAKGHSSEDDPSFKRLAYEVAFSEYAIAIAQLKIKSGDCIDPTDSIFEIRDTLNRITRKAASLYAQ